MKQPVASINICADSVYAAAAGRPSISRSLFQEERHWLAWQETQTSPLVPMSSRELIGLHCSMETIMARCCVVQAA